MSSCPKDYFTHMDYNQKVKELKTIVYKELKPLLQEKVAIFGLPFHGNIGDSLISLGEFQLLKELKKKIIYCRQLADYSTPFPQLPVDCTILLQGGGDFGDVWRGIQEERLRVISQYKNNRIICFPQTVNYSDDCNLKKDVEFLRSFPHLHLCARDRQSYNFLHKHFANHIHLIPDMAFCINPDTLKKYINAMPTSNNLYLRRTDKELASHKTETFDADEIVMDWPIADNNINLIKWNLKILGITGALDLRGLHRLSTLLQRLSTSAIKHLGYKRITRIGVHFLTSYDKLRVTRLHAGILAVLIGKQVEIIDNSYSKNYNFYTTWLNDCQSVKFM